MQGRLETAFRALPIERPSDPDKLSYEAAIPGIARGLSLMRRVEGVPAALRDAGSAATKKELADVRKHAKALLGAINELHKPAIEALNFRPGVLTGTSGLTTSLRILIAAAQIAKGDIIPDQESKRGQPKKASAHAVAMAAGEHYYLLTGDRPKRYGHFIKLLDEIFDALGIDASAEEFARQVEAVFKGEILLKISNKLLTSTA
jgi:hypothetical protein